MNNIQNDNKIEGLSEQLSLKLAQKLRSRQIDVAKMAEIIQAFFYQIHIAKDFEEIKKFVENS